MARKFLPTDSEVFGERAAVLASDVFAVSLLPAAKFRRLGRVRTVDGDVVYSRRSDAEARIPARQTSGVDLFHKPEAFGFTAGFQVFPASDEPVPVLLSSAEFVDSERVLKDLEHFAHISNLRNVLKRAPSSFYGQHRRMPLSGFPAADSVAVRKFASVLEYDSCFGLRNYGSPFAGDEEQVAYGNVFSEFEREHLKTVFRYS